MATIKFPIFCKASDISVLEQALVDGVLMDIDRICFCYVVDDGTLAYVDPDKNIHKIKGDNKVVVQNFATLPSVSEGDTEVLYVVDDIVYTFNGSEYKPSFYKVKIELDALADQVASIDNRLEIAEMSIANQQEVLTNLGVTVNSVQAELTNKADKADTYTKTNVDTLLAQKADSDDVYRRNYIDNALSNKADSDAVYSIDEVNNLLDSKSDKSDTYTKDEIDAMTNVEISSGETVSIAEYVDQSTDGAVQSANDYTDQQMTIQFI